MHVGVCSGRCAADVREDLDAPGEVRVERGELDVAVGVARTVAAHDEERSRTRDLGGDGVEAAHVGLDLLRVGVALLAEEEFAAQERRNGREREDVGAVGGKDKPGERDVLRARKQDSALP